ncbi:amidohydrolase family protein [Glutamicibacter sp. PS]|uniref:N-acetylglucosamine-6-phosphate deacetylase n=1 Tax=Glutamicibacter sp. PS TaxID=3075634 RepID=UPI0028494439|nr:amidohydrolase family protein [Glutamicibacter sp. PS]MDR4533142.1 amidohydrolase family protein [Glutamicibacter sp. PS]
MNTAQRTVIFATLVSDGQRITEGALALEGDRISFAGTRDDFAALEDAASYTDYPVPEGTIITPGLVDLHCHGAIGADFPAPEPEAVGKAIDFLHRSGTTTLLGSLVTAEPALMVQAAETLADFCEDGLLAGIHSEGPFLSAARCGAQDPRFLSDPDPEFVDELVMAARGNLRTMTYAPELAGSEDLLEQLISHGVVPSLGHTDASAAQTLDSLNFAREQLASAGVDGFTERPTVTHLFNGMPPLHHRAPGPVAACLQLAARGQAVVELIADGVHLDPYTVQWVFSTVRSPNILLVTDSMAAAGLADGKYSLGPQQVQVKDGQARLLSDGSLAGGTATLLQVVRGTVAAGVPLEHAILSATSVPATLIGLADEVGSLHHGFAANLLLLDEHLNLQQVFRQGELLPAPVTA